MKGLITRLINASKLNENEKQIKKKKWTDPNTRRKDERERIRSNPKKKITYNVILFCFVRVGKT